jgi:hypothetical protein
VGGEGLLKFLLGERSRCLRESVYDGGGDRAEGSSLPVGKMQQVDAKIAVGLASGNARETLRDRKDEGGGPLLPGNDKGERE